MEPEIQRIRIREKVVGGSCRPGSPDLKVAGSRFQWQRRAVYWDWARQWCAGSEGSRGDPRRFGCRRRQRWKKVEGITMDYPGWEAWVCAGCGGMRARLGIGRR